MGIEDYLISSAVTGVLAQRLVRALCTACRQRCEPPDALRSLVRKRQSEGLSVDLFSPAGCPACRETGYRGRIAIAELLALTPGVRRGILEHAEAAQIRDRAVDEGMETLYANGLRAVFAGKTGYDEILRVAQDVSS